MCYALPAVRERGQRPPFTDTEEELILQRSAALQQYQEQLAVRVQQLQATESADARDEAVGGSDVALDFVTL